MKKMNILPYLIVICLHCGEAQNLEDYHDSARMRVTYEDGRVEPPAVFLTCKKCNGKMELKSLDLIKV